MPAVWYIGQAASRSVNERDWAAVGISGRPAVMWDASNGWSVNHRDFTQGQLNLLNADDQFVVGAPDGPRIGMPIGVDYDDDATKGWVVEQILQRVGTNGGGASPGLGSGTAENGIPVGGVTGQMLVKRSNFDFDAEWTNPASGGGGTIIPAYESGGKYTRPTTDPNICVIFTGASDPGSVALENDRWERLG